MHKLVHPSHSMTSHEQLIAPSVHDTAMTVLRGLVRNHFGKRGRGRPRQNSEMSRIKKGLREMLRASKSSIGPEQELALLSQLLNRSLFEGNEP